MIPNSAASTTRTMRLVEPGVLTLVSPDAADGLSQKSPGRGWLLLLCHRVSWPRQIPAAVGRGEEKSPRVRRVAYPFCHRDGPPLTAFGVRLDCLVMLRCLSTIRPVTLGRSARTCRADGNSRRAWPRRARLPTAATATRGRAPPNSQR